EEHARRLRLSGAIDQLLEAVTSVARDSSEQRVRFEAIDSVLAVLAELPASEEALRSRLVVILGDLARDASAAARVIPAVYTAMSSASNLVRAQSSQAYANLSKRLGAEHLPELLHESFLIHLSDPYIAVHHAALAVLEEARLPDWYERQARAAVWRLV